MSEAATYDESNIKTLKENPAESRHVRRQHRHLKGSTNKSTRYVYNSVHQALAGYLEGTQTCSRMSTAPSPSWTTAAAPGEYERGHRQLETLEEALTIAGNFRNFFDNKA